MPTYESRFRPWLDDPGPWPPWADDDVETIAAILEAAVETATASLHENYGTNATLFGAVDFVERLAHSAVEPAPLFRTAIAIAAWDYYLAGATPPRAEPGGATNPANRKRWGELGPYLIERVRDVSAAHFSGSLLSRAVFAATADDAHPAADIERRVETQFYESGQFQSVDVEVTRPAPVAGGAAWLRSETLAALEAARSSLAEKTPVLIEVMRDPETPPPSAQVVVLFRIEKGDTGPERLYCYDPAAPSDAVALDVWSGPREMRIYDTGPDGEYAAPRGIRAIAMPKALPPLFGLRRYTHRVLPWRFFWWLKRRWNTLPFRKRERQLVEAPAAGVGASGEGEE